ncbi:MAG: hypothetical protein U0359_04850 [Byssovorax sp.]
MKTLFLALSRALLLLTPMLAACDGVSFACTEIGCADQLSVNLGPIGNKFASKLPITISTCIDSKGCEGFVVEVSGGALTCRPDGGETLGSCSIDDKGNVTVSPGIAAGGALDTGDHQVSVTLEDKDGMQVGTASGTATLTESRPNGQGCEPVCVQGSVTLAP